jgi:hypothetical protein
MSRWTFAVDAGGHSSRENEHHQRQPHGHTCPGVISLNTDDSASQSVAALAVPAIMAVVNANHRMPQRAAMAAPNDRMQHAVRRVDH